MVTKKQSPKKNKSTITSALNEMINCPRCSSDLRGARIPEKHRKHFNNETHYRRSVAIYSQERDKTTQEMCPDCRFIIWDLDRDGGGELYFFTQKQKL